MENKEPKTVRLSTVVLLFIILILIIALVLMYMHYNKDTKNEVLTNTNTNQKETTNEVEPEESNKKELSTNSSIVKEIYDYIPAIDEDLYDENPITLPNAYQTKKVTYDDLNSKLLLANAFFKSNKDMSSYIYI